MTATLIAVFGTLLGAIVSGLLQHRAARSVRVEAREDETRTAQLDAVTVLAVAVSDHRRAMWELRDAVLRGEAAARVTELRDESHRTRSAITAPAVRVRLLVTDGAVRVAADEAIQATYRMRDAADMDALEDLRAAALNTHDAFIERAADWLATA
ncbi:pRL2-23 [Streptomyces huasconensis]|uniref:pRL2-23 n=1 Tax=Streptomyces huasconensis TaxID=1854574 RepID=UPI0036FC7ECE